MTDADRQTEAVALVPQGAASAALRAIRSLDRSAEATILGRHACLTVAPRAAPTFRLGRRSSARAALAALVERQRLLERLLDVCDTLPFATGTRIAAGCVPSLIAANAGLISRLAERFAGSAQVQVTVGWDDSPQAGRERLSAAGSPGDAGLADRCAAELDAVAIDQISLPRDDGRMKLNRVLLFRRGLLGPVEAALSRIDALRPEGLEIRMIGPLPPVSFATLTVSRVTAADEAAARARLGLAPGAEDIRAAFRRRLGLGTGPAADEAGDALRTARDLLETLARARAGIAEAGLAVEGPALLLRARRDGEAAARAPAPVPECAA